MILFLVSFIISHVAQTFLIKSSELSSPQERAEVPPALQGVNKGGENWILFVYTYVCTYHICVCVYICMCVSSEKLHII